MLNSILEQGDRTKWDFCAQLSLSLLEWWKTFRLRSIKLSKISRAWHVLQFELDEKINSPHKTGIGHKKKIKHYTQQLLFSMKYFFACLLRVHFFFYYYQMLVLLLTRIFYIVFLFRPNKVLENLQQIAL